VITVGKVLHGLELLVNNADTGLMRTINDTLNICGRLAHRLQFLVQALGSLDSGLRVEFGWKEDQYKFQKDYMDMNPPG
jgi:hypothetical protein